MASGKPPGGSTLNRLGHALVLVTAWVLFFPWRFRSISRVTGALSGHEYYLLAIGVVSLHSGMSLLTLQSMSGHDDNAYWPRIVEFAEGLRSGQLTPRWASGFNLGYGEPSFIFLPPVFYYVAAPIFLVRPNLAAAENLASFFLLMLSGVGMYCLANEFFGRKGGLVAATAYLYAPYFLAWLYVRHALADFAAYAFIPLTFLGIYRFTRRWRYRDLVLGSVGVALVYLSSNHSALIVTPFVALLVSWTAWQERRWQALLRGALALILGLGLSAYFWLPALLEKDFTQLHVAVAVHGGIARNFVEPIKLLYSTWAFYDPMSFRIGYIHLVLIAAAIVMLPRLHRAARRAWGATVFFLFVVAAAVLMTVSYSWPIWDLFPILANLQLPWRYLSAVAVGAAFLCGFPFALVSRRGVGSSRVDLQACKLEYSIVSPK